MVSTLVVGTNTYQLQSEANDRLEDNPAAFLAWQVVDSDQKDRLLIEAFRQIQAEEPKEDGVDIDPSAAPEGVKDAQALLAYLWSQDASLINQTSTGNEIKEASAAPGTSIEFFRPTAGARFPDIVQEALAPFLSRGITPSSAPGSTDDFCSEFENADRFGLTEGLP